MTSEGIVYLASGSGALQRYDLAHGVWLEGYINDSGEPFDGFVVSDDEAVYGWQSDTVVNVSNGFRLLERFSSEVVSGVVVANGLVVTTSTELSVTGDGLGNRVVYDDEAALGFRLLHALTGHARGKGLWASKEWRSFRSHPFWAGKNLSDNVMVQDPLRRSDSTIMPRPSDLSIAKALLTMRSLYHLSKGYLKAFGTSFFSATEVRLCCTTISSHFTTPNSA